MNNIGTSILLNLSRTNILLTCSTGFDKYNYIVTNYENKHFFKSHTWKNNYMYIEFDYDEGYCEIISTCISDIISEIKNKNIYPTVLKINSSNKKHVKLIQKIIDFDYFPKISLERNYFSKEINFTKLVNCHEIICKNLHQDNLLSLPIDLEKMTINDINLKNKNVIFTVPNRLKKIFIRDILLIDLTDVFVKKILFINQPISKKNNLFDNLYDYDVLVINKYYPSKNFDLNNLSYQLKILIIDCEIPEIQPLPNSIEQLQLGRYSKNIIENLPSTLKKISFKCFLDLEQISNLFHFLPNNLEEIEITFEILSQHTKLFDIKLPSGLKSIIISKNSIVFDFLLKNTFIKNGIKYKEINFNFCDIKKIEILK